MHRDKWIVTGDKRAAEGEDIFYSRERYLLERTLLTRKNEANAVKEV